jgi:hypothetical protein
VEENLTYSRGVLSAEQIQSEITRFWRELETSPELEAELKASGFDPAVLYGIQGTDAITLRVGTSGADPISTLLIIAFAPAANRVLKDLWTTVLLPRIRRRWGDDAIGDERHGRDR